MIKVLERLFLWLSLPVLLWNYSDYWLWVISIWAALIYLTRPPKRVCVDTDVSGASESADKAQPKRVRAKEAPEGEHDRHGRKAGSAIEADQERESEEDYLSRIRFADWGDKH